MNQTEAFRRRVNEDAEGLKETARINYEGARGLVVDVTPDSSLPTSDGQVTCAGFDFRREQQRTYSRGRRVEMRAMQAIADRSQGVRPSCSVCEP